jgi:hypothetical protein
MHGYYLMDLLKHEDEASSDIYRPPRRNEDVKDTP